MTSKKCEESVAGSEHVYDDIVDQPPPHYESLSTALQEPPSPPPPSYTLYSVPNMTASRAHGLTSPNRRVLWYLLGLTAVVVVLAAVVIALVVSLQNLNTGDDTQQQPSAGSDGWGEWGEWGSCDVTCGGGWKTRDRVCHVTPCTGTDRQGKQCATSQCPQPGLPQWSSWGAWSSCSVTCGSGSQSRTRSCPSADPQCPGNSTQLRDCSGWSCPDCSDTCPAGGNWNSDCTLCECPGNTLTGQVVSSTNMALPNVTISPVDAPYYLVSTTDEKGQFSIPALCLGQSLLFRKDGYMEQTYTAVVTGPAQITLNLRVPLSMTTQPESKMRITNESAVLCCQATGTPRPDYYEWFKDGVVILVDVKTSASESSLVLEDVSEADAGEYRCRANNDFSAVYSEVAQVHVAEKPDDFCSPSPESHRVPLPSGCNYHGAIAYDVGRCPNRPCRQAQENQTLVCELDKEEFCCGATSFSRLYLNCTEDSDFIFVVESCGCTLCSRDALVVKGQLRAADTKEAVPYGKIQLQSGDVTWANGEGQFSITAPPNQPRIALAATDMQGNFVGKVQVVNVDVKQTVPAHVAIDMIRKAPSIVLNVSEESLLTVGGGDEDGGFAGIHIPANSVYSADGSLYTGQVKAALNVIDPRNATDVLNAPSDYTCVDEEGQQRVLETFGMFNLQLEDESGNSLQTEGDLQIMLDPQQLGYDASYFESNALPSIWVLDADTGHWVKVSDMRTESGASSRFKRQASRATVLIADLSVSVFMYSWFNFDYIFPTENICVSKIQLYETNEFIDVVESFSPSALVNLGSTHEKFSILEWSNFGICLAHPCEVMNNTSYEGYLYVDVGSVRAFPISDSNIPDQGIKDQKLKNRISYRNEGHAVAVKFSFFAQQSDIGPYYKADDNEGSSSDCHSAGKDHYHFLFYKKDVFIQCSAKEEYKTKDVVNGRPTHDKNLYLWYTNPLFHDAFVKAHTVVYIKVITNTTVPVLLEAVSKVGKTIPNLVTEGDKYGSMFKCTNETDVAAVCLEVKPSGFISRGPPGAPGIDTDETWLQVRTQLTHSRHLCHGYRINSKLNDFAQYPQPEFVDHHLFDLRLTKTFEMQRSHEAGVYWYTGDSQDDLEDVKKAALEACKAGINPASDPGDQKMNKNNYALEFFCD